MKKKSAAFITAAKVFLLTLVISISAIVGAIEALPKKQAHVTANAATVDNYYSSLDEEQLGTAFRADLADLITETHTYNPTYGGLSTVFPKSDADPNKSGNILWFYSGTSVSFSGNFGSSLGATNREHVWPKFAGKAFDETKKAGSDAHHLRPTEFQMNSTRNNNNFGEVAQTTSNIVKQNGSTSYENLCYQSGGLFYPGEGYRGATARILMYVQVRWGDEFNLSFSNNSSSEAKVIGKISDLMKWHLQEPPTAEEIARNEAVAQIQGNRNPFIDHPEYAEMIYCYDGKSYNKALLSVVDKYDNYTPGSATPGGTVNPNPNPNPNPDPDPTPDPDPSLEGIEGFKTAVKAIEGKSGEGLYKYIAAAVKIYDGLSDTQKASVKSEYATLKAAAEKYNGAADLVNRETDGAARDLLTSIAVGGIMVLALFKAMLAKLL